MANYASLAITRFGVHTYGMMHQSIMIMIIPCGKTPLLKKGTDLQEVFGDVKNNDSDSRPEIFNRHELYEETVQVDVDLGFDVDGCVGDNPKGR